MRDIAHAALRGERGLIISSSCRRIVDLLGQLVR